MAYSKILIAVDSSEYAMHAAEKGFALARQLHAKVTLLFVIDTAKALGNVDAGIFPEQALIILKKEAEDTLDQLMRVSNDIDIIKLMPEGHPREDILKTAESWQADLLVIGTHGRTGLSHLLMGSNAEYIIRHTKIPVMVVPAK